MKRTPMLLIMLCLIVLLASQIYGETDITTSGEVRIRCEYNNDTDKVFDKDDATVHQTLMRTRLNIDAEINDNTSAFIQLQDSRRFGDPESGDVGDHGDVYLHQGYITVNHLWNNGLGVKIGRFEVNLGNQRVFGAVGWSNVGRVWDGTQFFFNSNNNEFKGYWLRPRDDFNTNENTDFDIFGISANFKPVNLELFGFYVIDAVKPIATEDSINRVKGLVFGLYYYWTNNQFDFNTNFVYQSGKYAASNTEYDVAAFLFTYEAGYTFESNMSPRLAAGIDFSSGDDNGFSDGEYKSYYEFAYTGHKFRGYMDYFINSTTSGLVDIMLRGKLNPVDGWTVKGDFHIFSSAVERNASGDKGIGSEFDLTVSTSNISGVKFDAGFSMFMPHEEWVGSDAETALWYYLMMTAGF